MDNPKLLILEFNYWEHFKAAKDLALIYPLHHPKRVAIETSLNELQVEINNLKNGIETKDKGIA